MSEMEAGEAVCGVVAGRAAWVSPRIRGVQPILPERVFQSGDEGGVGGQDFRRDDDGAGGSGFGAGVLGEGQGLVGLQQQAALAAAG